METDVLRYIAKALYECKDKNQSSPYTTELVYYTTGLCGYWEYSSVSEDELYQKIQNAYDEYFKMNNVIS